MSSYMHLSIIYLVNNYFDSNLHVLLSTTILQKYHWVLTIATVVYCLYDLHFEKGLFDPFENAVSKGLVKSNWLQWMGLQMAILA